MNKTQKRQLNLRNKLFAAIAMLLVSSIMMVSTTYAWFTLSTAPEVQGITTTVGTNGNLEIALSPLNGETASISTGVTDSNMDWVYKNTTWGNLLDLSDAQYELDTIVLQPSQLIFGINDSNKYKVDTATTGLAYPVYGSDGRISALSSEKTAIGYKVNEQVEASVDLSEGFRVAKANTAATGFGVRAVGTSSGLTTNEIVLNSGVSALRNGLSKAGGVASTALSDNGQALANMMVDHAMFEKYGKEGDIEDFSQYKDELEALVTSLEKSVDHIDGALKGYLTAFAAKEYTGESLTTAVDLIEAAEDLSGLLAAMEDEKVGLAVDGFDDILDERDAINDAVVAARGYLNTIISTNAWNWDGVTNIISSLMNVNGTTTDGNYAVTINGMGYSEINTEDGMYELIESVMENQNSATIQLNENSGVYYEIHEMASKIYASTKMTVDASVVLGGGEMKIDVNTIIETTFDDTTTLAEMLAVANGFEAKEDEGTDGESEDVTKLDVFYGYILDFVFRTNAADSKLKLQTEGTNRVYSNGTEATMGNGSTISFQVPAGVNDGIVKGMLEGIRVVFFNTADGTVYGVAKATAATAEITDAGTTWVGELELVEYNVVNERVSVTDTVKEDAILCDLNQNQPQRVSVMVTLDGNDITNQDILAEGNLSGTLNLQFSSTAALVPMDNADLKTMEAFDVKIGETKIGSVETGGTFTYQLDPDRYESVKVEMGTEDITATAYSTTTGLITVENVTDVVTITVEQKTEETTAPSGGSDTDEETEPTETEITVKTADGLTLTEDVAVTVKGYKTIPTDTTTQQPDETAVTLNDSTTSGTVKVYTGGDDNLAYTVSLPVGMEDKYAIAQETGTNTWILSLK